jgi:hypothetical protein
LLRKSFLIPDKRNKELYRATLETSLTFAALRILRRYFDRPVIDAVIDAEL